MWLPSTQRASVNVATRVYHGQNILPLLLVPTSHRLAERDEKGEVFALCDCRIRLRRYTVEAALLLSPLLFRLFPSRFLGCCMSSLASMISLSAIWSRPYWQRGVSASDRLPLNVMPS